MSRAVVVLTMSRAVVELTEGQRRKLRGLLDLHARGDYRGALVAQISNTGQSMAVEYVGPPSRKRLQAVLQAGADRVKQQLKAA